MRSIFQSNADKVILQIMIMRTTTNARQILLSQEYGKPNGLSFGRLIHEMCVSGAALVCNMVKASGDL